MDPSKYEEAKAELQDWWSTSLAPTLAGFRAAAERQTYQDQRQAWADQFGYDQAQAAERRRVGQENRQREIAGLQAGNADVARWNAQAPYARSNAFVGEYAKAVENLGTPNF